MRTLEAIIGNENNNLRQVVLYPEGMFYKAYERSAYLCVVRISPFKPSCKPVKYLGCSIVSIGFPKEALAKYFRGAAPESPGGRVVVELSEPVDVGAFERWKASLPLKTPRAPVARATAATPVSPAMMPAAGATDATTEAAAPAASAAAPTLSASLPAPGASPVPVTAPAPGIGLPEGSPVPAPAGAPVAAVAGPVAAGEADWCGRVLRKIRDFRLESATPLQCMAFIDKLKREIDGRL